MSATTSKTTKTIPAAHLARLLADDAEDLAAFLAAAELPAELERVAELSLRLVRRELAHLGETIARHGPGPESDTMTMTATATPTTTPPRRRLPQTAAEAAGVLEEQVRGLAEHMSGLDLARQDERELRRRLICLAEDVANLVAWLGGLVPPAAAVEAAPPQ
jgi:hypothetical protein